MANCYSDHPEIGFYLNHPLMARIVELKEKGFADAKEYDYAPVDLGDAIENYKQILDITGDVAANIIEPNSEAVDLEGPHLENGRMIYASKTYENLDATRKAGLWGVSMPRRYGGLNLPNAVFSMLSEMISAADAGFQNIWSLQSCIDTLYEFGSEEQRQKYIPRVRAGEGMSMDLTEPDAGSDLQRVMLKATFDEKENCWRLNGVKRFITNGDSDTSTSCWLVLRKAPRTDVVCLCSSTTSARAVLMFVTSSTSWVSTAHLPVSSPIRMRRQNSAEARVWV